MLNHELVYSLSPHNFPENYVDLLKCNFIYRVVYEVEIENFATVEKDFEVLFENYSLNLHYVDNKTLNYMTLTNNGLISAKNCIWGCNFNIFFQEKPDEVWLKLACNVPILYKEYVDLTNDCFKQFYI